MNRVVVWVLGSLSGVLLVNSMMFSVIAGVGGYGVSSGCSAPGLDGESCTPILQQVTVGGSLRWDSPVWAVVAFLLLAILIGLPAWIGSPILAQRRGSSARPVILIVSIIASAIMIVNLVFTLFLSPALATPETCINGTDPQVCFSGVQATVLALLGIGLPTLLIALLLGMPAWVMALTETARRGRWGWFVAVLLLSPIAAMLYGFFGGRAQPPAAAAPTPNLAPASA